MPLQSLRILDHSEDSEEDGGFLEIATQGADKFILTIYKKDYDLSINYITRRELLNLANTLTSIANTNKLGD